MNSSDNQYKWRSKSEASQPSKHDGIGRLSWLDGREPDDTTRKKREPDEERCTYRSELTTSISIENRSQTSSNPVWLLTGNKEQRVCLKKIPGPVSFYQPNLFLNSTLYAFRYLQYWIEDDVAKQENALDEDQGDAQRKSPSPGFATLKQFVVQYSRLRALPLVDPKAYQDNSTGYQSAEYMSITPGVQPTAEIEPSEQKSQSRSQEEEAYQI